MSTDPGEDHLGPKDLGSRQQVEQDLVVLRQSCEDLGEVMPAARKLIGKSTAIQKRGYSVARLTLEAVLVREDGGDAGGHH